MMIYWWTWNRIPYASFAITRLYMTWYIGLQTPEAIYIQYISNTKKIYSRNCSTERQTHKHNNPLRSFWLLLFSHIFLTIDIIVPFHVTTFTYGILDSLLCFPTVTLRFSFFLEIYLFLIFKIDFNFVFYVKKFKFFLI